MRKKKLLITALVLAALIWLVMRQVHDWKKFDWQTFKEQTEGIHLSFVLLGVALIYGDYFLRAWRWKILLRPVCKTTSSHLLAPTMIGFTGLALLGRPGEFIRPYLIARKQRLSMASQIAVWTVERIFDTGAFGLIMALNILISAPALKQLPGFQDPDHPKTFIRFEIVGFALLAGVAFAAWIAFRARKNPKRAARFAERLLGTFSAKLGRSAFHRVHAFGEGLNTIPDVKSFLQLGGLSLLIWLIIGLTYLSVTHAYSDLAPQMTLSRVLLLTAASVAGGVLQLPVVGGGSQAATIGILFGIFGLSRELATSCGIMLWLVTFMSVIPAGLLLAHREHVSLTRLEEESIEEEEKLESEDPIIGPS
ncbi:MAG TPA: lysylphosphatidylglycerol synthase transmembrane domain-containing protein [Candidatus Angelobacter sp.]|nr:lysylphosphatidylglycerol synthase transmembrane domain-containing protein [Candidatus Angelobacter sp.]